LADRSQGLGFLETGLAQIRQGFRGVSAAPILQERRSAHVRQPAAAIGASRMRWEA
jgi:hypothetical protein